MQIRGIVRPHAWLVCTVLLITLGACARKQPPVARPTPVPPPAGSSAGRPLEPPAPPQPPSAPLEPLVEEELGSRSIDELNRDSPLRPVFFGYDSSEITPEGQAVLQANAELLQTYTPWIVTIEGHCDERGTPEYNLALGERRALAAQSYLISLGIPASRLRTVSYGKEFPFDPRSNEAAWAANRRAHFVITAK